MEKEEAIKVIKENYPHVGFSGSQFESALRELIPELRESEDERIRKAIITYLSNELHNVKQLTPRTNEFEDWIAYLEKQKDAFENGRQLGIMQEQARQELGWPDEKQKEHQNKSDALGKALGRDLISPQDKDKNLDEISQDYVNGVKEYNPEPTWDLMQTAVCYGYHLAEQKLEQYDTDVLEKHITKDSVSELAHTVIVRNGWEIVEKEQKPDDDPLDDPKFLKGFDTGREVQRIFDEQKPAEWSHPYGENETVDKLIAIAECLEMDGDCLFNGYSGTECGKFLRELARKQVECKPAEWSDTDNIGWDEAFACVTRAEKAAKNEEELQNAVTAEEWLKEIKFKYCVHPVKQEWSKNDLGIILAIRAFYKCEREDLVKYFESLRPSWKPSEEQIEAIDRCVDYLEESDNEDAEIMESLQEQLHKLM